MPAPVLVFMMLFQPDEAGFVTEQILLLPRYLVMSRVIVVFMLSVGLVGGSELNPTVSVTSDQLLESLNSSLVHQIHSDKSFIGALDTHLSTSAEEFLSSSLC